MSKVRSREILGVRVDFGLSVDAILRKVDKLIRSDKCHLISTTNPQFIMSAQKDEEFRDIVNNSALSVPDGIGVLYADLYLEKLSQLKRNCCFVPRAFINGLITGFEGFFNRKDMSTITGVELTEKICERAAKKGYTVFLLGGRRRDMRGELIQDDYDMAKDAAKILQKKYPGLTVVGATSAYSRTNSDDYKTVSYIQKCMREKKVNHIDVMFVAYNPVGQEKWINRNKERIPVKVSMGVGRTFDYITGKMKKPANIFSIFHVEWLYSMFVQPWRIKRVFNSFPMFPLSVFVKSIKK